MLPAFYLLKMAHFSGWVQMNPPFPIQRDDGEVRSGVFV